ncbi:glycosyltransferase family 2 protein [Desulfuromonas versatilis]|uniref:glycosyltransferase family 2 protein n=1 Tax=Desulfuromonas versatilis TaxID=2802975 RepID=UPI001C85AF6A|nr:glycosyltransferase family 2 protein [Desulfuromonas versatilis]
MAKFFRKMAPVSVVIPCFRCADTVSRAVTSVASQTLVPFEVLLVDDCSADGTLDLLYEVARKYPDGWVRVLRLSVNSGPSLARNVGWDNATQPYIAFLDADDSWHPLKLELQMETLLSNKSIALIAHKMNVQSPDAPTPAVRGRPKARLVRPWALIFNNPFPTASVVLRRDLPFRFDDSRRRVEDFLLWAQIMLSGRQCFKINQVLASYHKPTCGAGGLSGDMSAMHDAAISVIRELRAVGLFSWWEYYATLGVTRIKQQRRRIIWHWKNYSYCK